MTYEELVDENYGYGDPLSAVGVVVTFRKKESLSSLSGEKIIS